MTPFLGEMIGTALLILLGNGVVANVVLNQTKAQNSGWIVITWGWGMAVFVAVFTVAAFSGAHLNPAVSVGLAIAGKFEWARVPAYVAAQFVGAFVLVFAVLFLAVSVFGLGALDALPVGLLVLAIGLSLGGTTGYAINPARDLGPRIMHAILPMPGGKRDSDWGYAWIPVVGPILGAVLAGLLYLALQDPSNVNFR